MKYMDLIIIVDCSTSVKGQIEKINEILRCIYGIIRVYPEFAGVYLSVMKFPVKEGEDPFYIKSVRAGSLDEKCAIELTAWGNTNPASVLKKAAEYAQDRYKSLKRDESLRGAEIAHPLILFFNDGKLSAGTDSENGTVDAYEQYIVEAAYDKVCREIRELEAQRKFQIKAFGMGDADMAVLKKLTGRESVFDFTENSLDNNGLTDMLITLCAKVYEQTSKYIGEGEMARRQVAVDKLDPDLIELIGKILINKI